jgi:hypothetical protein
MSRLLVFLKVSKESALKFDISKKIGLSCQSIVSFYALIGTLKKSETVDKLEKSLTTRFLQPRLTV